MTLNLCVLQLFLFTVIAGLQSSIGYYVQDIYGVNTLVTSGRVGVILLCLALMMIVAQLVIVPRLYCSAKRLIMVGSLCCGLGHCIMLFSPVYEVVVMAAGLIGLGFGFTAPAAPSLATMAVGARERGAASGLVAASQSGGFVLGPLIFSSFYEVWGLYVFILSVSLSAVCLVLGARVSQGPSTQDV